MLCFKMLRMSSKIFNWIDDDEMDDEPPVSPTVYPLLPTCSSPSMVCRWGKGVGREKEVGRWGRHAKTLLATLIINIIRHFHCIHQSIFSAHQILLDEYFHYIIYWIEHTHTIISSSFNYLPFQSSEIGQVYHQHQKRINNGNFLSSEGIGIINVSQ